ncbi:MAG: hypothetical protein ACRD9R_10710, partial [Pyrinomonadaceae bacterium]
MSRRRKCFACFVLVTIVAVALPPVVRAQEQQRQPPPPAAQQRPELNQPTPTPASSDAAAAVAVVAADDDVVLVETNLVALPFSATDRNRRYVTTLRPEDVRVYEDETPQAVSVFQRETELPLALAILID